MTRSMKASELTGAALDYAVAMTENSPIMHDPMGFKSGSESGYWIWDGPNGQKGLIGRDYSPSTNWALAGPIIERESISLSKVQHGQLRGKWDATVPSALGVGWYCSGSDENILIAAMRCYVSRKLGDSVDIPCQLINGAKS